MTIIIFYYMANITSGEMANCDWLRRNFAGPLFSVIDHGPLRKKQKHFKVIFQSETVKLNKKTMYENESEEEHTEDTILLSRRYNFWGRGCI